MKTVMAMALTVVLASSAAAGVKVFGRDYWANSPQVGALAGGYAYDGRSGTSGAYVGFNMIMAGSERFNAGMGLASFYDGRVTQPRWIATTTTHAFGLEIGFWSAWFHGYDGRKDPYGFVVGKYWRF